MIHADDFCEFPIIPDSDVVSRNYNNIYNWFKYWFRQYREYLVNENELTKCQNTFLHYLHHL